MVCGGPVCRQCDTGKPCHVGTYPVCVEFRFTVVTRSDHYSHVFNFSTTSHLIISVPGFLPCICAKLHIKMHMVFPCVTYKNYGNEIEICDRPTFNSDIGQCVHRDRLRIVHATRAPP